MPDKKPNRWSLTAFLRCLVILPMNQKSILCLFMDSCRAFSFLLGVSMTCLMRLFKVWRFYSALGKSSDQFLTRVDKAISTHSFRFSSFWFCSCCSCCCWLVACRKCRHWTSLFGASFEKSMGWRMAALGSWEGCHLTSQRLLLNSFCWLLLSVCWWSVLCGQKWTLSTWRL